MIDHYRVVPPGPLVGGGGSESSLGWGTQREDEEVVRTGRKENISRERTTKEKGYKSGMKRNIKEREREGHSLGE